MARTPARGADAQLIADLADLGLTVTQAQLERWRAEDYLPRRPPGRPSSTATHPANTLRLAAWLAVASHQGRSLGAVAWCFWAQQPTARAVSRLRSATLDALDRYGRRLGVSPGPAAAPPADADTAWQTRTTATHQLVRSVRPGPDLHTLLTTSLHDAGEPLDERPGTLPNVNHRQVLQATARLLAGGADDITADEYFDALRASWPQMEDALDTLQSVHRQHELDGQDLWAQSPLAGGWPTIREALAAADAATLCRAVELNSATSAALHLVVTAGQTPYGEPLPTHARTRAMADPMWEQWGRHTPLPDYGRTWQSFVAFQSALSMIVPGRTEELARYRTLLEQQIQAADS